MVRELMDQAGIFVEQNVSSTSALEKMLRQIEKAAAGFGALNDPNYAYVLSNIETD